MKNDSKDLLKIIPKEDRPFVRMFIQQHQATLEDHAAGITMHIPGPENGEIICLPLARALENALRKYYPYSSEAIEKWIESLWQTLYRYTEKSEQHARYRYIVVHSASLDWCGEQTAHVESIHTSMTVAQRSAHRLKSRVAKRLKRSGCKHIHISTSRRSILVTAWSSKEGLSDVYEKHLITVSKKRF